jgi:hypothetical protein
MAYCSSNCNCCTIIFNTFIQPGCYRQVSYFFKNKKPAKSGLGMLKYICLTGLT